MARGQFELLKRALDHQREHILATVDGLDESQLTTSLVPSHWCPAGLVQHLTLDVERFWFQVVFAGQSVERDGDPERCLGRRAGRRSRRRRSLSGGVLAGRSSHRRPRTAATSRRRGRISSEAGASQTSTRFMLHVVTETACHAGHMDIVRENIDGTQQTVLD